MDSGSDLADDFQGVQVGSCLALDGGLEAWTTAGTSARSWVRTSSTSARPWSHSLSAGSGPERHGRHGHGEQHGRSLSAGAGASCPPITSYWNPARGLGLLSSTLQISGSPDSSNGIGFGFWPELRAEVEIDNWGLGLSLGYLEQQAPPRSPTPPAAVAWPSRART